NRLHTGNMTKKSSGRARLVLSAFCVVAAIALVVVAFAAGPKDPNNRSSESQIVADKNPLAEKYDTLVMRGYFRDRLHRHRLAQELSAEEAVPTGGYLAVIRDRNLYYELIARGLRVEIDEDRSRNISDLEIHRDTFFNGYKTVEEIYAYLDQKVAEAPDLV